MCKERGITLPALWNRIYRFKLKYLPRWHRRKERERAIVFLLLLLGGAALLVALAIWLLAPAMTPAEPVRPIRPAPVPVLVAPPAPEPTQFNQAAPTDGGTRDKPTNKPPGGR